MGKGVLTGIVVALSALLCMPAVATAQDTKPPTTNLMMASDVGSSRQRLFFFSNEPASAIDCRLDSEPWFSCMGPGPGNDWVTPEVLSGFHTAQIRSTDLAGNVEDPPLSHTYYVLPIEPRIESEAGSTPFQTGWTADTTPTFHFATPDPRITSFSCGIDFYNEDPFVPPPGAPPAPCPATWTPSVPLEEGTHYLGAYSVDELGVTSKYFAHYKFKVDSRPPVLDLITPGRVSAGTPVKIRINAYDENPVKRECLLDRRLIPCKPQTIEGLSPGAHRVFARIEDRAGNLQTAKAKFRIARK